MRVLLVSDWMSHAGGSEVYVAGLKHWLREAGDEVRLLTCGTDEPPEADASAFGTDNVIAQTALQLVNPLAVGAVRRLVRDFKPDAALVSHFAFHLSPAVLTALRPVPTVASMMDYKAVCPIGSKLLPDGTICRERAGLVCWRSGCTGFPHWLRDQPRYALIRAALARVGQVVCASPWMQEELLRNGIACECIPIPVAAPSPSFRHSPAPDPLFVYVGRLSREKGVELLLRAFRRLVTGHPSARLRIVGDGPLRRDIGAVSELAGLTGNVEFTGRVSPAAVEAMLRDAWALVAPSRWAEPYGLAVAEAIVRGVPVVTTVRGGPADTVEEGVTGLLVPNGDEVALASALEQVASGRAFRGHEIPPVAVERLAQRLSPRRHVDRLHAAFRAAGGPIAS